jgi:hypothetical protein
MTRDVISARSQAHRCPKLVSLGKAGCRQSHVIVVKLRAAASRINSLHRVLAETFYWRYWRGNRMLCRYIPIAGYCFGDAAYRESIGHLCQPYRQRANTPDIIFWSEGVWPFSVGIKSPLMIELSSSPPPPPLYLRPTPARLVA